VVKLEKKIKKEYKEEIRQLLWESPRPLDVEKIRVACGIGNWQTALKHCLELLWDEKIQGVKTSKSWIFWTGRKRPGSKPSKKRSRRAR
jgi:hypothetical protein